MLSKFIPSALLSTVKKSLFVSESVVQLTLTPFLFDATTKLKRSIGSITADKIKLGHDPLLL